MTITSNELAYDLNTRYAMFTRPINGLKNVVLDSFMPVYFRNLVQGYNGQNEASFPDTYVAIGELTSDLMNVPLIPRDELFKLVGYDEKTLKDLLRKVASKKLTMTMLGFGGTGANTLYWLYEMSVLCNVSNIFKDIIIMEPDSLEFHNTLRMPMSTLRNLSPLITSNNDILTGDNAINIKAYIMGLPASRTSLLTEMDEGEIKLLEEGKTLMSRYVKYCMFNSKIPANIITRYIPNTLSKLLLVNKKYTKLTSGKIKLVLDYFNGPSVYNYLVQNPGRAYEWVRPRHMDPQTMFFYGAPDLNTRQLLSDSPFSLITATHGNDDAALAINPTHDTTFQRESYGMIKLTTFFLNQIRLAIGLLEYLASDYDLTESKTILDYSYPRDAKPLPTKRQWHLQLEHTGIMEETI